MAAVNGSNGKSLLSRNLTQILTVAAGALVLGLQGVSVSEISHGNSNGEKRMEMLEELLKISKSIETSLENQNKMLSHDEESISNQTQIIQTLKDAIRERREWLKQNPTPSPSPTPENH
jgi:hypothetical protein